MGPDGCQKYGSDGYVCDILVNQEPQEFESTLRVSEQFATSMQEEPKILAMLTILWMVNQRREGRIE